MSRRIFFTFLSILVSLPFLVLIPTIVRGQTSGAYGVSGFVCDDLNFNRICEPNEPGIRDMMVYADNTGTVYKAYTDAYGHWQIPVLPPGAHSIEIYNAGAGGSRPTTSEKFLVSGPTSNVQFGIQKGGYAVDGSVIANGRPVAGTTVYVDSYNRTAVTDSNGYYRFEDIGYDSSPVVPGVSGGHNIYVGGYNTNPVLVNPSASSPPVQGIRADFNVTTDQAPSCTPTYARDPNSGVCGYFNDRCNLPSGWQPVTSCDGATPPPGGQCTPGQQVGSTQYRCNNMNQQCTVTTHNNATCTGTYENQSCGYIVGQCGYTCPPGYSCLSGTIQPDTNAYLQGQQSGFEDFNSAETYDPNTYYDASATWVDNSWQTWYDQSTPYIEPDQSWNQSYWY